MAEIVVAATMPHILMAPGGIEERANRVLAGMREVGSRIADVRPDVLLIVSNDHLFNLDLTPPASFLVGVAEHYAPFGDMDIPRAPAIPGNAEFGRALTASARTAGVDVALLESVTPDHGIMVPMLFANPERTIPMVPVYVNYMRNPAPEPGDCWRLGEVIGEFVRQSRPADERVAVLGTGGLSHWVGYDEQGINETFDREFLADLAAGNARRWSLETNESIERLAGNGGLEISNWLIAAAAANAKGGDYNFYVPMPEWMTGMGGMVLAES